jgi:hypothetical protein
MPLYNNVNQFTPGSKGNMRIFLNREFLQQYYLKFLDTQTYQNLINSNKINQPSLCNCEQQKSNKTKQGWNDPMQSENCRISQILSGSLGGKLTFGNLNNPISINELGGWEGQPGGSLKPLRNKF